MSGFRWMEWNDRYLAEATGFNFHVPVTLENLTEMLKGVLEGCVLERAVLRILERADPVQGDGAGA